MSHAYKVNRKTQRATVRKTMADVDKEIRATWKRPPLWVYFLNLFRRGYCADWEREREELHKARLNYAFRKTAKQVRGR